MPRRLRITPAGLMYHVINRAAGRATIFRKEGDYLAFENAIAFAHERVAVGICGMVLMPNHFHLVLLPRKDNHLSEFMRLLTVTHTNRWHAHYHTTGTGPLYQGRFKSFPIEQDEHALTVLRYVDRNPVRANLVSRVQEWRWGSFFHYRQVPPPWLMPLNEWPIDRRADWTKWVNAPQTQREEDTIHECIRRGRPFGGEKWTRTTVTRLGLESAVRPAGRPKKREGAENPS